ncbi:MAG: FKBP-type peptidyl-prolyl cis-trans isomerase [Ginsengibacter sp.]
MKKWFALSFVSLFILVSCNKKKDDTECPYKISSIVAPAMEQEALKDSLDAHGIQAIKDPAGFYYKINKAGTDPKPKDLCSAIAAYYTLTYFNGVIIQSTQSGAPAVFQLSNVITGWQKALLLVGQNADIDIYIPPSLAYGPDDYTAGNTTIPGNSYLVFHVVVAQVQ